MRVRGSVLDYPWFYVDVDAEFDGTLILLLGVLLQ
ncbi:uncharacterized protein METZ01_LOCUS413241 [marine metagenome]|uniref:Uncharacterized protein n=1 Tax=marine metagenome TaxID=408172 RepID=A0A382WNC4_9ZZZZ